MDVEKILLKLEELNYVRLNRIIGDYYSIYCPMHKDGQEKKPSCGVLLHEQYKNGQRYPEGFCHCFTCGYAKPLPDMITDILKAKNIRATGLDWLKENVDGFDDNFDYERLLSEDIVKTINSKFAVDYVLSKTNANKVNHIEETELKKYRFTVPYMYERGLTDDIIEKYDIGYDSEFVFPGRKNPQPSITFPIKDNKGQVIGICRRSIEGKNFHIPPGIDKPVYGLYEIPEDADRLVICESCFNALTCVKHGVPAVAVLGTGTSSQMDTIKKLGMKEIILGFDPDEAGIRAENRWKKSLKNTSIVWTYRGIPEGKDINDLTDEEFNDLYLE